MPYLNPNVVVDGESLLVKDLLAGRYSIPNYQRDFAWGSKQVSQLWDDLREHYTRIAPSDQITHAKGYFLGAMVVIEEGNNAANQVVDGQQRLTTLSVMAAVLHEALDKYAAESPQKAPTLQALVQCWKRVDAGNYVPVIEYSDPEMKGAYAAMAINSATQSQRDKYWETLPKKHQKKGCPTYGLYHAFLTGYKKVEELLAAAPEGKQSDRIIGFANMFLECVVVLRIKARSYESAYAVFESLNDRGLRLSQADLIKSQVLSQAAAADREEISDAWTNVKQYLEETPLSPPELLHYTCLHRIDACKAQQLFSFVKDHLGPNLSSKDFTSQFQEDAKAIVEMLVTRPASWRATTLQMLDDLSRVLKIKLAYPMLLAAHRRFSKDADRFDTVVRLVMNFTYRFMKVGEGSPDKLADIAAEVGRILRSKDSSSAVLEKVSKLFLKSSPDGQFADDFRDFSDANTKLAYFTVYHIERYYLKGTIPLPHGNESNLEHIMPKTPTTKDWPKAEQLKGSDTVQYEKLIWRIGNLLPLPEAINKSIKNKGISHKMSGGSENYMNCHLYSPPRIEKYLQGEEWNEASINLRQSDLAAIAPKVWPLSPQ